MTERRSIKLKKNDIILSEGEIHRDLFLINKGKVMAFVTKRTEVTPIAYFEEGDFIGDTYPQTFFYKKVLEEIKQIINQTLEI
ncbi:MAG: cyclic nucleotide-binding domain-containing protein [Bdellovibrionota bacterium]|nr:cyclic nucleotide-binding domain-containing protein [Bdellovibrionota bacterium]